MPATLRFLLLASLASLAPACSGGGPGDSEDVDVGGEQPDGVPPVPRTIAGEYEVQSQFAAVGSEGGIAQAAELFAEMGDDPNDPATWLIDVMLDEIDTSLVRSAVNLARPSLDVWLNELLAEGSAADYAENAAAIASALETMNAGMGMVSTLNIREWTDDSSYRGTHDVDALQVTVGGDVFARSLADLGSGPIASQNIAITLTDGSEVAIDDHEMTLPYGALVMVALEEKVIPAINPSATNVHDLLRGFISCQEIGASIADYLNIGSADTYDGPCNLALSTAASHVAEMIEGVDAASPATLTMSGFANLTDRNGDGQVDGMAEGNWYGNLSMGELEDRSLVEGQATFSATRK